MRHGIRSQIHGMQFTSINTESSHTHLGILVTKKFSKKAVTRNQIKKQIAMAFLPLLEKESAPKNIVCKIMQPIQYSSFQNLKTTIEAYIASLS